MALKLNIELVKNCITFVITTAQIILNIINNIEKGVING